MKLNPKVIILLPYGAFVETNLQYKTYLDHAKSIIDQQKPDVLVFCGGLKSNDISEAQSVKTYLNPPSSVRVLLEETSTTTPQNLEFAQQLLQSNQITPTSLHIICDSIRVPKVFYHTLTYFSHQLTEEQIFRTLLDQSVQIRADFSKDITLSHQDVSIHGISLNRNPTEISQQILATMMEVAATKYPTINQEILRLRNLQWQREQNL